MATSSWTSWPQNFVLPLDPGFAHGFPALRPSDCAGSFSKITKQYNCFAWAACDTSKRWEPDPWGLFYWPSTVPRELTVPATIAAYRTIGYEVCNDGSLEGGIEKIAIYAIGNVPKHAARQLENGNWTTKFGHLEDVEHITLDCLYGPAYGVVQVYMSRPRSQLE